MTISERLTQARHDRGARRVMRAQRAALARELAVYNTPAERMEIELIARRDPSPYAAEVLDVISSLNAGSPTR